MKIGMMWLMSVNDKRMTLEMEIKNAVQHYKNKYGTAPNTCHLHPIHENSVPDIKGMAIVLDKDITQSHLWLGLSEQ